MTYASETCTNWKALEQRLAAAERRMERAMIGMSGHNHKTNELVGSRTKVRDIYRRYQPMNGLVSII